MVHPHAHYFDAVRLGHALFSIMHARGIDSPGKLARLVTNVTGYAVEPSTIEGILEGTETISLPLTVAIIETLEPEGGIMFTNPAFRTESILHVRHLRQMREVGGEVA